MSWRRPGVGAAIGLAKVIDRIGGEAIALGNAGRRRRRRQRNILHREGFFDGIDAMMLIYPGMDNIAHSRTVGRDNGYRSPILARRPMRRARPELGINALDAMLLAFNGIGAPAPATALRGCVWHGIITKGRKPCLRSSPITTTAVLTVARQRCGDPWNG